MKFSSVTSKLNLLETLQVEKLPSVKTGDVILVEVLSTNTAYPYLEQVSGELTTLKVGDKIVGAIGARQALRGFVGYSPDQIDEQPLSLLNMGGIVGCCVDSAVGLGDPSQVKYLGTVVDDKGIVNINRVTLPHAHSIVSKRPIILILGTCMNVGKTSCATYLIDAATKAGHKIGAAKIAGVAAIKDLQAFEKAGAIDVKSFLDCGLPSTVDAKDLSQVVKNIINALEGDVLIIELGDGILGHYKVETVYETKPLCHLYHRLWFAPPICRQPLVQNITRWIDIKLMCSADCDDNISGLTILKKTGFQLLMAANFQINYFIHFNKH